MSDKKGKIVVVDGNIAAGKSWVCEILSEVMDNTIALYDIEHLRKPITSKERMVVKKILQMINTKLKKGYTTELLKKMDKLFLEYDLLREKRAKKLKNEGKTVIMERNHTTTFAYSYAASILLSCKEYYRDEFFPIYLSYLENEKFVIPDVYFWLEIPEDEVRKRRIMRNDKTIDSPGYLWNYPSFNLNLKKEFFNLTINYEKREPIVISTLLPKEDVLKKLIYFIDKT